MFGMIELWSEQILLNVLGPQWSRASVLAERQRLNDVESIDYLPPNSHVYRAWLASQPHRRGSPPRDSVAPSPWAQETLPLRNLYPSPRFVNDLASTLARLQINLRDLVSYSHTHLWATFRIAPQTHSFPMMDFACNRWLWDR